MHIETFLQRNKASVGTDPIYSARNPPIGHASKHVTTNKLIFTNNRFSFSPPLLVIANSIIIRFFSQYHLYKKNVQFCTPLISL